jgi:hypothetical protein
VGLILVRCVLSIFATLKMKVLRPSDSVIFYQTRRRYVQDDIIIHNRLCDNLKPNNLLTIFFIIILFCINEKSINTYTFRFQILIVVIT